MKMHLVRKIIRLVAVFFFILQITDSSELNAQRIPRNVPTNPYPNQPIPGREFENPEDVIDSMRAIVERDSFVNFYHHLTNIQVKKAFRDTALDVEGFFYDKANNPRNLRATLGNHGSASTPLIYNVGRATGFNMGHRQYEQYDLTLDSFKFFEVNRPYADLSFSPIWGTQQDFVVGANYAQGFSDNTALSLNYTRLSHDGSYKSAANQSTNFSLGVKKKWMKERMNSYVTLISNVNRESINGGITDQNLLTQPSYNFRSRVPVRLEGANLRNDKKSYGLHNFYRLGDTIAKEGDFLVSHSLTFEREIYKFYDFTSSNLPGFYKDFLVDDRGVRVYNNVSRIKNNFNIFGGLGQRFKGRVGLLHELIRISDDVNSRTRNDITASGEGDLRLSKNITIALNGRFGLGSNIGTFDFNGATSLNIAKLGRLDFGARLFNLEGPLVYEGILVNGQSIFSNSQLFTNGLTLFGDLEINSTKSKISLSQSVINNTLVFGADYKPKLIDGAMVQWVGKVEQSLKFRKWNTYHLGVLQQYSSREIRLPSWYTYNTAYWRSRVFRKVLDLKIGADILLIPRHKGMNYFPLLGQFYNADVEIPQLNQSSIYLHGKISAFRFFVRFENVESYVRSNVDFQVGTNPLLDSRMRVGLRWILLD
jgi:hypothetical protein